MSKRKPKEDSNRDHRIAELATKVVAPSFEPYSLFQQFTDYDPQDIDALCAAVDPKYAELKAQAEKISSSVIGEISWIREQAMFYVGLAVGQRVR